MAQAMTDLETLRHSTAHLMAQAVLELYPGTKLAIGPPVEDGFYYDVDPPQPITGDDLPRIEERMREIAQRDLPIERIEMPRIEALKLVRELGQDYKVEIIEEIPEEETISFYRQGDFIDLCRGPHVERTSQIKHFKLLSIAGAYWRGDARNKMLTRLYGTAWFTEEELQDYLRRMEEAKRRDHRKLGRELGIFLITPEVGSGLPLWLPKGAILRDTLETFLKKEQLKRGYLPVVTPHIGKLDLYKTSGHWYKYQESMFHPIQVEDEEYMLKPMNCPHHIQIYKSETRSYRDLPLRLAEFGTVYRYEQSGELGGLTRVRGFTVDDSHIFVTPEQLEDEFKNVVELVLYVFERLGLEEYRARVGLRDPKSDKYVGSDEAWEQAQSAILQAVEHMGIQYTVAEGEAAFYGPKLDFLAKDCLGRMWQLGTVQVDYTLPERFDLEYIGPDGKPHRPVMIHRAPFGSLERLIGILIEHYGGAFPLWLAPVQVIVLPIADRHVPYAQQIRQRLEEEGFRVEVDARNEKTGFKVREAELQKIPYMLVVGDRDMQNGTVSVRKRSAGDQGAMTLDAFVARLKEELGGKVY
ncbi:MAG: threonine--tRNA ligase [Armatimonadota bacterium]|nr:threonine--tRNA ligase [Armatimonadota bacterium]MDW8290249.1 threonine--tRNA ligase [Armatimonadota bacterium]